MLHVATSILHGAAKQLHAFTSACLYKCCLSFICTIRSIEKAPRKIDRNVCVCFTLGAGVNTEAFTSPQVCENDCVHPCVVCVVPLCGLCGSPVWSVWFPCAVWSGCVVPLCGLCGSPVWSVWSVWSSLCGLCGLCGVPVWSVWFVWSPCVMSMCGCGRAVSKSQIPTLGAKKA